MADLMHVDHTPAAAEEEEHYDMEYRSKDDDAWYSVRLVLSEGEDTLTVKFQGFSELSELSYKADEFENAAAVDEFVKRFRPVSEQLQDRDCSKVFKGMKVCAALSSSHDDLRFYDAVVDDVSAIYIEFNVNYILVLPFLFAILVYCILFLDILLLKFAYSIFIVKY